MGGLLFTGFGRDSVEGVLSGPVFSEAVDRVSSGEQVESIDIMMFCSLTRLGEFASPSGNRVERRSNNSNPVEAKLLQSLDRQIRHVPALC